MPLINLIAYFSWRNLWTSSTCCFFANVIKMYRFHQKSCMAFFFCPGELIEILRIFNAFCYQKGHHLLLSQLMGVLCIIQHTKNSTLFMLCTLRCPRQFNVVTQTHYNHLVINCHSFLIIFMACWYQLQQLQPSTTDISLNKLHFFLQPKHHEKKDSLTTKKWRH